MVEVPPVSPGKGDTGFSEVLYGLTFAVVITQLGFFSPKGLLGFGTVPITDNNSNCAGSLAPILLPPQCLLLGIIVNIVLGNRLLNGGRKWVGRNSANIFFCF